ncbi:MAG: O-antigen ligase family protein [bacterium]
MYVAALLLLLLLIASAGALYCLARPKAGIVFFVVYGFYNLTVRGFLSYHAGIPQSAQFVFSLWQDAILVILLFHCIANIQLKIRGIDWLLFLYVLTGFVMMFIDPDAGRFGFRITFYPPLFYLLLRNIPTDLKFNQRLFHLIGLNCFIVALAGIVLYFVVPTDLYFTWAYRYDLIRIPRSFLYYWDLRRMTSIVWNPMALGSLMSMASLIFLVRYLDFRKNWDLAGLALCLVCLAFSLARGAWLSFAVGLMVVMFFLKQRAWPVFFVGIIATYCLVAFTTDEMKQSFSTHVATLFPSTAAEKGVSDAVSQRTYQWNYAMEIFQRHPFGLGTGRVGNAQDRLRIRGREVLQRNITDGNYHKVLAESGIEGGVAFMGFILLACMKLFRLAWYESRREIRCYYVTALSVLIGFSIQGVGTNVWDFVFIPFLIYAVVAVALNVAERSRTVAVSHF